jgi:hypothetical protein
MAIPESSRRNLARSLDDRRRQRWSELGELRIRYRGSFVYIDGVTAGAETLKLCRLRYLGSPRKWGFAIYLASKDGYEDSVLPTGSFSGGPEEALDCACGLYLDDLTAWTEAREQPSSDSRGNL